ncbi:MAG: condensation domain-containing protein [Blastocatellia bacterium]
MKQIEAIYTLSPQQKGMLFETLSHQGTGIYIEQQVFEMSEGLNVTALERALHSLIDRHPILRTCFVWRDQDEPYQVVRAIAQAGFERHDWRDLSPAKQQEKLEAYLDADRQQGFEMNKCPLLRIAIMQTAEHAYHICWTTHHIIIDGWSQALLLQEFLAFYDAFNMGRELRLEPSRPYRDYIAWLRKQDLAEAERYWREKLKGFARPTLPGIEQGSEPEPVDEHGDGEVVARLSLQATAALQKKARQHCVTINTITQGIWALLLSRYSGQNDIVFGTTVSGRPTELDGIESTVGLFINTIPLRVRVGAEQSLWDWIGGIQNNSIEQSRFDYCSTGQIHEWSDLPASLPLYNSILVFENYPVDQSAQRSSGLGGNSRKVRSIGGKTKYDLAILAAVGLELEARFIYNPRRFYKRDLSQMASRFISLLEAVTDEADIDLDMLAESIPIEEIPGLRVVQQSQGRDSWGVPRSVFTPIEDVVANIWADVLGLDQFNPDDDFFELGGHSLLATQVVSRIKKVFDVSLSLRTVFEAPTLCLLSRSIETALKASEGIEEEAIKGEERKETGPLSYAQQRLWFMDQLDAGNPAFNVPAVVEMRGELNVAALEQSMSEISRRQHSLRTAFRMEKDEAVQEVQEHRQEKVAIVELSGLEREEAEKQQQRVIKEEAGRRFELEKGYLRRAVVIKKSRSEHVLAIVMHHIISDGWSLGIMVKEMEESYEKYRRGEAEEKKEKKVQYIDYAIWERRKGEQEQSREKRYWREQLKGVKGVRIVEQREEKGEEKKEGGKEEVEIGKEVMEGIRKLSRQEGATLFISLLAAYNILLSYLTKEDDIVVGSPIAGRNRVELESLIGCFINTIVLRLRLGGDPEFRELLRRARGVALGAFAHQNLPFDKLVADLLIERDLSKAPLYSAWFVLQNTPKVSVSIDGLRLEGLDVDAGMTRFDLALNLWETPAAIKGHIEYNANMFSPATIARLARHFELLLKQIVAEPDAKLSQLMSALNEADKLYEEDQVREYEKNLLGRLNSARRKTIVHTI